MVTVEELYRAMSTTTLLDLRAAFQLDRAGALDPTSRAFTDHRLALIARELQTRGHVDHPSITCPVCKFVSYNPHDIANQYCGACHRFHGDLPPTASNVSDV